MCWAARTTMRMRMQVSLIRTRITLHRTRTRTTAVASAKSRPNSGNRRFIVPTAYNHELVNGSERGVRASATAVLFQFFKNWKELESRKIKGCSLIWESSDVESAMAAQTKKKLYVEKIWSFNRTNH